MPTRIESKTTTGFDHFQGIVNLLSRRLKETAISNLPSIFLIEPNDSQVVVYPCVDVRSGDNFGKLCALRNNGGNIENAIIQEAYSRSGIITVNWGTSLDEYRIGGAEELQLLLKGELKQRTYFKTLDVYDDQVRLGEGDIEKVTELLMRGINNALGERPKKPLRERIENFLCGFRQR